MLATQAVQSQPASADVFALQSHEVVGQWHWIEPFLRRVEGASWTPADVRAALVEARSQLWGWGWPPRGVIVTSIESLGESRYGLVWVTAGDGLDECVEVYRTHIEPWLAERGCKRIEIVGRKGWGKLLLDYTERARVFVRDL